VLRQAQHERKILNQFQYPTVRPEALERRKRILSHERGQPVACRSAAALERFPSFSVIARTRSASRSIAASITNKKHFDDLSDDCMIARLDRAAFRTDERDFAITP